jgi:DNA-binding protein HU-beta
MNSEVSQYIESSTELSKSTVSLVLTAFFNYVQISLRKNNPVVINNFGTFSTRLLKEREGRNPKTGEPIEIPEKFKPVFKFSSNFEIAPEASGVSNKIPSHSETKLPPPIPPELLAKIPERFWYMQVNGVPVKISESELIKNGLTAGTPVWNEEITSGWKLANDVPELNYLFVA